jgi:Holliday junction resolvase RusA-like endonuclease
MRIVLTGEPISNNSIYRTMCRGNFPMRYLIPKAKALKEDYQWQIKSLYHKEPMKGKLEVSITTYHGNHRKNDWDNFHKLSMDSMTGLIYEDDSQIICATVKKDYDRLNPRIEIEIRPLLTAIKL